MAFVVWGCAVRLLCMIGANMNIPLVLEMGNT